MGFHVEVLFHPIMVWISVPKQLIVVRLCQGKRQTWYNSTLASRRKRLTAHFEDLEQCYFSNKMAHITGNHEPHSQIVSQVWTGTGSGTGFRTGSGSRTGNGSGSVLKQWGSWDCSVSAVSRGKPEHEPVGWFHGVSGQVHPLQLGTPSGHPLLRQRPLQRLQYRFQVKPSTFENTQAGFPLPKCLPCSVASSSTVTVTTSPLLVWPRRSRCLSTAQWSRMQLISTTPLTRWPAIPKSGRPNVLLLLTNMAHIYKMFLAFGSRSAPGLDSYSAWRGSWVWDLDEQLLEKLLRRLCGPD